MSSTDAQPRVAAIRKRLRARLASWFDAARAQPVFCVLFAWLAAVTIGGHWRTPIGLGQDYHYHLMVSALNAQPRSNPVAALYHPISWLDANTLLYHCAWPFEQLFDPVRAFAITVLLLFYLGFPTAVAYALARTGRAPWAALFAFASVYTKSWSNNGYAPFYTSATFMVLALAEWSVLFDRSDPTRRTPMLRGALFATLLFLSHGHVYAWTTVSLGFFTIIACVRDLFSAPTEGARVAVKRAFDTAWRSLVAIGPSLVLFGLWFLRTQRGSAAARTGDTLSIVHATVESRVLTLWAYFIHSRGDREFHYAVGLALVALAMLLVGRRASVRGSWFEAFTLLSWASFFLLPETFNGQSVAPRHIDIALWALPLTLWQSDASSIERSADAPKPSPWRRPAREYLLVALVFAFALSRVRDLTAAMERAYTSETRPLLALVDACRRARRTPFSVLTHVPMTRESLVLHSPHMHQAHETLAALCNVETPVYDTHVFPHNLLAFRYRAPMPAPVYILERDTGWYTNTLLWQKFDLVLTSSWTPTAADDAQIAPVAELIGASGPYRLYRRR